MKIGIRPENCKFAVNKDKRKVVCVLEGTDYNLKNFLDNENEISTILAPTWWKETLLPDRFIGIATCSPEDEWNEEIGKRLAFMRMKRTYYKTYFNQANKVINRMDNELNHLIDVLNAHGERVTENLAREHERIEKIIGHE